jgi:hypothetical protein
MYHYAVVPEITAMCSDWGHIPELSPQPSAMSAHRDVQQADRA